MVELIVGKWYEVHTDEQRWIFKLSDHKDLNSLPVSKACTPHDNYIVRNKGHLGSQYMENVKYANMEEVYRFFPEERPKEPTYELW